MRNVRTLIPLFMITVLILAACVDPNPQAPADAGANADADVAATEAPAEEAASGEAAMDGDTIHIGGIHPLTGGLAADGIQMDNAIQMAIAEINAAGGVLGGTQLAYLSADSTGSPEVGQTEAERLVSEGADALICCFQSSVTGNVATIAERESVPLVIDVAVMDAILDQGYGYTFRIQPNATAMGVSGANYLKELAEGAGAELNSVVLMYEGGSGFGDSVAAAFRAEAEALGIEILDEITYDAFGSADLTTELTKVNSLAPDVLVVTGYYNDGLLIARNAEEVAVDVDAVFGVAQGTYDQDQFVSDAGDLAQCFYNSNYHWDASNPNATAVRDAFEAEYGEPMRTSAVYAYQATYMIADAIERAGSGDASAIRDALAEASYTEHLLPQVDPVTFDETGENINASPVLMQVQDGAVVQVWPAELAEAEPVYPCVSWQ